MLVSLYCGHATAQEFKVSAAAMTSADGVTKFVGNVRASGPDLQFSADTLSLSDTSQRYDINGTPAQLELGGSDGGISLTLRAPTIYYDVQTRTAHATGGSHLQRDTLSIKADTFSYDVRTHSIDAQNSFILHLDNASATGDTARIENLAGPLRLHISGTLATFILTHAERSLKASANTIDYSQASGIVHLRGNATANFGANKLHGEQLSYNLKLGTFAATPHKNLRVTAFISLP